MERSLQINPAWDKRNPDPAKNYGIHGVDIRMVVKGKEGAVQFVIYTQRHLPKVIKELVRNNYPYLGLATKEIILAYSGDFTPGKELEQLIDYEKWISSKHINKDFLIRPIGADVGYHSKIPRYEGQTPMGVYHSHKEDGTIEIHGEPLLCGYLDGAPCYYDGSSLEAVSLLKKLVSHGEEYVWKYLENYYTQTFNSLPNESETMDII